MEKLIPKCKDNKMRFMGADGKIYPCCFIYTQKEESFDPWIKKIKEDDSQLDYRNHTLDEILNSNIFKKLKETFDNFEKCLKPCKKNCGSIQGFKSTAKGNPKTEKFEKR